MANFYEYPVFEADQVLTADNLNSVVNYLTQQDLSTRRNLIGIGIVCGLEVKVDWPGYVRISKGVGTTSMGCLITHADTKYTWYRPYTDAAKPAYQAFKTGGGQYPLWELMTKELVDDEEDTTAKELKNAGSDFDKEDMAVLLYLEIEDVQLDNCIGEDCKEKGISREHTLRPLLIRKSDLLKILQDSYGDGSLSKQDILNKLNAECQLPQLSIERLDFKLNDPSGLYLDQIDNLNTFRNAYAAILEKASVRVGKALHQSYELFAHELKEQHASNPFAGFENSSPTSNQLSQQIVNEVSGDALKVQYAYDYLKDLIMAYDEWADASQAFSSVCCPNPKLFERHLMLGCLFPENGSDVFRHGFYSSAAINEQQDAAARFTHYFNRMVAMVESFSIELKQEKAAIKITPSKDNCKPLSTRAIPYYYNIKASSLHKHWSYYLARRCASGTALSYHAEMYAEADDRHVTHPLLYNIDPYPFFRIEGHIGQEYVSTKNHLLDQIKDYNLPIDLVGVKLSRDWVDIEIENNCFADIQVTYKANRDEYLACLQSLKGFLKRIIDARPKAEKDSDASFDQPLYKKQGDYQNYISTTNDFFTVFELFHHEIGVLENSLAEHIWDFKPVQFKKSYRLINAFAVFCNLLLEILSIAGAMRSTRNPLFMILALLAIFLKPIFGRIIDDCMESKFMSLWCQYLERKKQLQMAKLFPGLTISNAGIEHRAGAPAGGTFILVYDEIPKDKEDKPEEPEEPGKPEEDPCFESEKEKGIKSQVEYIAEKMHKISYDDMVGDILQYGQGSNQNPMAYFNSYKYHEAEKVRREAEAMSHEEPHMEEVPSPEAAPNPAAGFMGVFFGGFDANNTGSGVNLDDICQEPEFKPKQYRVVSDFALPYRCCSACKGIELEEETDLVLDISPREFCFKDGKQYPFTIEPEDGILTGDGTFRDSDGAYYIIPKNTSKEDVTISLAADGKTTSIKLKVYNPIAKFAYTIEQEGETAYIALKNQSTGADSYDWVVNGQRDSTNKDHSIVVKPGTSYKVELYAYKGKCKDVYSDEIVTEQRDPVINLPQDTFCAKDKTKHLITVQPLTGLLKCSEEDALIKGEKAGEYYFIPEKAKKASVKFDYDSTWGKTSKSAELVVTDLTFKEVKRNAKFITLQAADKKKNSIDTIAWTVNGQAASNELVFELEIGKYDGETALVEAQAIIGPCRDSHKEVITLREIQETVFELEKAKGQNNNSYCNNDGGKYAFTTEPQDGSKVTGLPGGVNASAPYFFQPFGLNPGNYTAKYKDKTINVVILEAPEISFSYNVVRDNGEAITVRFVPSDNVVNKVTWQYGDGQSAANQDPGPVMHTYNGTGSRVFTVEIRTSFPNGCARTYSQTINLQQLDNPNDGGIVLNRDGGNPTIVDTNVHFGGTLKFTDWASSPVTNRLAAYNVEAPVKYYSFVKDFQEKMSKSTNIKKYRAGKLNDSIAKEFKANMAETLEAVLTAHKKQDTEMENHLMRLYYSQVQELLGMLQGLTKEPAKTSSIYKMVAQIPDNLKKLHGTGVDVRQGSLLKEVMMIAKGKLEGKPNLQKVFTALG